MYIRRTRKIVRKYSVDQVGFSAMRWQHGSWQTVLPHNLHQLSLPLRLMSCASASQISRLVLWPILDFVRLFRQYLQQKSGACKPCSQAYNLSIAALCLFFSVFCLFAFQNEAVQRVTRALISFFSILFGATNRRRNSIGKPKNSNGSSPLSDPSLVSKR